LAHKEWMAQEYGKRLGVIKGLKLPITKDYAKNVYWMYGLLVEDDFGISRGELCSQLKERGVDTRDFFASSASQPSIRDLGIEQGPFPAAFRTRVNAGAD